MLSHLKKQKAEVQAALGPVSCSIQRWPESANCGPTQKHLIVKQRYAVIENLGKLQNKFIFVLFHLTTVTAHLSGSGKFEKNRKTVGCRSPEGEQEETNYLERKTSFSRRTSLQP